MMFVADKLSHKYQLHLTDITPKRWSCSCRHWEIVIRASSHKRQP